MKANPWVLPAYAYAAQDTVGTLFGQFMRANGLSPEALADFFGCHVSLVKRWLAGEITEGLRSKFAEKVRMDLGIDLGRCVLLEAKRQLRFEGCEVPHERWQTIDEIVASLREAGERMTVSVLAQELSFDERLLASWLVEREAGKTRTPEMASLVEILRGLVRGLPQGNRDDVLFRRICRLVGTRADVAEVLQKYQRFIDAVRRVLKDLFRGDGPMAFERKSGIPRSQLAALGRYAEDKKPPKTYFASIGRVVRYLLSVEQPELVEHYDALAPKLFEGEKLAPAKVVAQPAPARRAPAKAPIAAPSSQVDGGAKEHVGNAQIAAELEALRAARMQMEVATAALHAATDRLAAAAPASVDATIAAAFAGKLPLGTTIDGTPFCLTTETFQQWKGGTPPAGWKEYLLALCRETRRVWLIVQQLPSAAARKEFVRSAEFTSEVREMVLALLGFKLDALDSGGLQLLVDQRSAFLGMDSRPPAPAGKRKERRK